MTAMNTPPSVERLPELELSDEDILDAMQHIPGYLDITTEDFRAIYHVAHAHALNRLFGGIRAAGLMRGDIEPLRIDMSLADAARSMMRQGCKALPVADAANQVLGILTETDFLRWLGTDSLLALLLPASAGRTGNPAAAMPTSTVGEAMTAPVVSVGLDAGVRAIVAAFHRHPGHHMPVLDAAGRLCGLLSRKQFIAACPFSELP
jgi:CBS-domain-containing membrane protein